MFCQAAIIPSSPSASTANNNKNNNNNNNNSNNNNNRWRRILEVVSYMYSIRSCVASHINCFSTQWTSPWTRCGHCGARFSFWQRSGIAGHVCTIGSPVTFNLDRSISTSTCTSRSRPMTVVHLSQPRPPAAVASGFSGNGRKRKRKWLSRRLQMWYRSTTL